MTIPTILLSFSAFAVLSFGFYLLLSPGAAGRLNQRWTRTGLLLNMSLFAVGMAALLFGGAGEVMAATEAASGAGEISLGLGLALIGIGLPTALATIGAGIAVSSVGSASLAVITEKPELFGRTLIYLGLAEGIAIYGLVVSILLLGKI